MTFSHGVASGDPLGDRVVIWTRITTDEPSVTLAWVLARDAALEDIVASGEADAEATHDHTVHVDVTGLEPATCYHYAFTVGDETSPVGRTRTLPAGGVERVRFAACSCAKFDAGFCNAYARIAEHDDLDFVLHLGDYIYEAAATATSSNPTVDLGRPFDPVNECRTLEDYRRRYAQYHREPEAQAMHWSLPMIATLDDHELADGAWAGGSDGHDEAEMGPWEERRDAALQARWEWLPARPPDPADLTRVFRTIALGELADIQLLDIRSRRDEPVPPPAMDDPARSMLGAQQRAWLLDALEHADETAWQIVATPSIFTPTWTPDPAEPLRTAMQKLKLMDDDVSGPDFDQWDGYPVERSALTAALGPLPDIVLLSGDIHSSVAGEVRDADGLTVAVELTTASVSSRNLDDRLGVPNRDPRVTGAEDAFVAALDHVAWCDFASHGYMVVDLDARRLRGEWWYVDTTLERSDGVALGKVFEVPRGRAELVAAD
ncbi:MAG TPA: alkaline phosphatase D family protein [Solirubrobacteraceae bacterium]|nr:alkaline phosphatase D family protein [Solirubrobacteraceae bacterium]